LTGVEGWVQPPPSGGLRLHTVFAVRTYGSST
jgi:hypothetical protein